MSDNNTMSESEDTTTDEMNDRETIAVETTTAMRRRIELETDEDETVGEWIETVINQRLNAAEKEYMDANRPLAMVDVDEDVVERARLRAEDAQARGKDITVHDVLLEYASPEVVHTVDGDPVDAE